jgi:FkbM family methyltransferase
VDLYNILPDKFILTDSDLEFNKKLPSNFIEILSQLSNEQNAYKIGFALDISDFDKMFQGIYCFNKTIYEWELQNWNKDLKIDHPTFDLFKTGIDTTFCLINKTVADSRVTIRVAGDFTAKHIPWYIENPIYTSEELVNLAKKSKNISTIRNVVLNEYYQNTKQNDWIFFEGLDSCNYDIKTIGRTGADELLEKAEQTPNCVAVNTLGFLKNYITYPLCPSPWFKKGDGIWIKRSSYELSKINDPINFLPTKKIVKNNEEIYIKNDTKNQNYNFWTKYYPTWEQETFRIFDTHLQKDKVFIDIGGWIGTTCIYGSKKSKHVYVIEADPIAFADLSSNCTLNSNNITPIHRAIYNKSDTTVSFGKNKFIKNAKLNDSMSQIYTDTSNNDCFIVKTITLSTLIDEYNINPNEISLIKVDIEGGEENILDNLFTFNHYFCYV